MTKSFYTQTLDFRTEAIRMLKDFEISKLYTKDCCVGYFQKYTIWGENITIEFRQKRLYSPERSYRTNCDGEIIVKIYDEFENESEYNYQKFQQILELDFSERPYRLIVPSDLLSEEIIKGFTMKIIMGELPTVSKDAMQFVYYTDLDG